jgi:cold shock CspA family protein
MTENMQKALLESVLNVAEAHTWVKEIGDNRGQAVEAILKRVYLQPGNPWCAAFVSYVGWSVLRKRWPLPLVGGCVSLFDYAKGKGMIETAPAPGDIFLMWSNSKGRFAHTGFVSGVSIDYRTIEGNTNPEGSREGDGVYIRTRKVHPNDRFIRWINHVGLIFTTI